jgi:MtfA peptidase
MLGAFRRWRRSRVLGRARLDPVEWRAALARYPFTGVLGEEERERLREWTILFLHEKSIVGAGGLEVRDEMRMSIAVQACMLILNLDIDYYRGWTEVIVYPDEFLVRYDYVDEDGIAHRGEEPLSGESWLEGPVILSWADAQGRDPASGYNVVLHEFAHKLDMLNGDANGFPPLHSGMDRRQWAHVFGSAYEDLRACIERGEETALDAYAAENPAEFFAVLSEAFFETPSTVLEAYRDVYRELAAFYRQDPAARLTARGGLARKALRVS